MEPSFQEKVRTYSHLSILLTFMVALVILGQPFIVPLAFSFILAVVLNPLLQRLERMRIPRVLGIVLLLLGLVVIISTLVYLASLQMRELLQDLPSIQERIIKLFRDLSQSLQSSLGIEPFQDNGWWKDLLNSAGPVLSNFLNTTSSVATFLIQLPIYVFLILLYREKFSRFLASIWGDQDTAQNRSAEIKNVLQGYVGGLFIVIGILAVLNSIGLLLLDIRYAIFFGVLSAILTVVPYLGNFIGGSLPFLVALVTKDSAWYAVGVIGVYVVVQFLEGNFITPNIMGSQVSVNPLAALVALIIGGQLLGIAGIILAIPFLGIIKTLLSHSPTLRPWVILIEDKPSRS